MASYAEFEDEKVPTENCDICYMPQLDLSLSKTLPQCSHSFCLNCLTQYFQYQIDNGQAHNIQCPHCSTEISRSLIISILNTDYIEKYDKFILRNNLVNNPYARLCPQPDCEGYDMGSLKKKKLICNLCKHEFCFFCTEKWHGNTKCEKKIDEDFEEWAVGHNVKFCPKCKRRVEKNGGCPNMTCLCGNHWCWRCGGNAADRDHWLKCLFGYDVWNIKRGIIILLVFAPIFIYFIPAVVTIVLLDFMNEADDSYWIIRNRRYFYPLLILLSPVIEILFIAVYVFVAPCFIIFSYSRKFKYFSVIFYIGALGVSAFLGILAIGLAMILSFLSAIIGLVLLALKIVGKYTGREVTGNNFYPQIFE
ncbi:hypothetical protein SteCoe_6057 [Stentor coeruleus]|uniref:RBR-type E3 ubiquitin transferase n=1 Tax=Stentor coeruleus TaxID=5963 RepID=A0A1R2CQU5_9CILI|nr:hypothetical protein SteCoe_6057 [Stentor coeruleus]